MSIFLELNADGTQTAIASGPASDYVYSNDGYAVQAWGPDGYWSLPGVDRLEFADSGVAFDVNGTAGQAYRLYQAALDRQPDPAGLGYWIDALDHGRTEFEAAGGFMASPEFRGIYGPMNNVEFTDQLYMNVLHRPAEAAGLAYWLDALASGLPRAQMLVDFSESPENQANVVGQIEHGMVYVPFP